MNVVACERMQQYEDVKQEAPWQLPEDDVLVPKNWPNKGEIVFKDFKVRYHGGLDLVLREVTFSVKSSEKVGIVGRTGAGKSSLTLSLFRIIEASGGKILIDCIDISKIGLHTLRARLTIIPQVRTAMNSGIEGVIFSNA
jgi:ABC-type multidrug transport system fused ATPase/permease subunit